VLGHVHSVDLGQPSLHETRLAETTTRPRTAQKGFAGMLFECLRPSIIVLQRTDFPMPDDVHLTLRNISAMVEG
jgi:hypothetical protein